MLGLASIAISHIILLCARVVTLSEKRKYYLAPSIIRPARAVGECDDMAIGN